MVRGRLRVCLERLRFYYTTHPFQAFSVSNIGLLEWVGCLSSESHTMYLTAVLLQGYQSYSQENRFPFSSPHARHLVFCQKSACPDSLCWGFGLDWTSRMVSFMISGFWEPSWILSSVLPFTSFSPTFDSL